MIWKNLFQLPGIWINKGNTKETRTAWAESWAWKIKNVRRREVITNKNVMDKARTKEKWSKTLYKVFQSSNAELEIPFLIDGVLFTNAWKIKLCVKNLVFHKRSAVIL